MKRRLALTALFVVLGSLPAAAETAEELLARADVLAAAGEWNAMLVLSERALALDPFSESARLRATLALTRLERWAALERAADALVALYPEQGWGWVRLGLARLHDGNLAGAHAAYARAREIAEVEGYALLGLGFTARARGVQDEAERLCREAATRLGAEAPAVALCLRPLERSPQVRSALWGAFAGATDAYSRSSVWSVAAQTRLAWSGGPALGLGFAYSQTELRLFSGDYHQLMPSLAFFWDAADWQLGAGTTFVWRRGAGEEDEAPSEFVADLHATAWLGDVGLGLQVATLASERRTHLQFSPRLSWGRPEARFGVWLGGHATWWADPYDPDGDPLLASVEAGLRFRPVAGLSLWASGWWGRRMAFVESGAGWFWNTDDRLQGGWSLGAELEVTGPLSLAARFSHDLGTEQSGETLDFHLFTGRLGLVLTL